MGSIPQYVRTRSEQPGNAKSDAPALLKLLLPVDATERSRWSIGYVMALHKGKHPLEVHLLFVAERITAWQVLRFRTQSEIAAFQRQYGQAQLEDAMMPLRHSGIVTRTHYREGNIAFEILDCAEELGCDRIVLPLPHPRWTRLLNGDVVREVLKQSHAIPVVTVDRQGVAHTDRIVAMIDCRHSS